MSHAVLFVCLGNICRSPLAEGVFRSIVDEAGLTDSFEIDSAGTGAWHVGNPPDPRSIEIASKHGIDISGQRARQVEEFDFERFDTILAMDRNNLASLKLMAGHGKAKVRLFLNAPAQDVPDPYYGGPDGFEDVYQLVRAGGQKLLEDLT
ncbi:low molecular weight protein-tyrosine-phosphatase [Roseibium sp. SCP14]|uniref:low molecular weight protein-tyrosine-phosphatase n=1 Tax=Roseibium sp. SCP14 TaxID=3141375 RepID=UPI003339E0AF